MKRAYDSPEAEFEKILAEDIMNDSGGFSNDIGTPENDEPIGSDNFD